VFFVSFVVKKILPPGTQYPNGHFEGTKDRSQATLGIEFFSDEYPSFPSCCPKIFIFTRKIAGFDKESQSCLRVNVLTVVYIDM